MTQGPEGPPRPAAGKVVLNMVHGWPDDQRVKASITESGVLAVVRDGTPSFLDQIGTVRQFADVWLGPGTPATIMFKPQPTANYIADGDRCSKALQAAVTLSENFSVPWFNHPRSIARNTRDQVSHDLQGIPGVVVPRTIRVQAPTSASVGAACTTAKLRFPIILRVAGRHGGKSSVLVRDASEIASAWPELAMRGDLYATEFVDYRSPDGFYRKHRLAVIGGRATLRHLIVGRSWLLSAGSRILEPPIAAEERAALSAPLETLSPRLERQIAAIHDVVGLDYLGIDCCIRPDGTLILFEANPTMNILFNSFASPNMWDAPIARCRDLLLALLDAPERWVGGSVLVRGRP